MRVAEIIVKKMHLNFDLFMIYLRSPSFDVNADTLLRENELFNQFSASYPSMVLSKGMLTPFPAYLTLPSNKITLRSIIVEQNQLNRLIDDISAGIAAGVEPGATQSIGKRLGRGK